MDQENEIKVVLGTVWYYQGTVDAAGGMEPIKIIMPDRTSVEYNNETKDNFFDCLKDYIGHPFRIVTDNVIDYEARKIVRVDKTEDGQPLIELI